MKLILNSSDDEPSDLVQNILLFVYMMHHIIDVDRRKRIEVLKIRYVGGIQPKAKFEVTAIFAENSIYQGVREVREIFSVRLDGAYYGDCRCFLLKIDGHFRELAKDLELRHEEIHKMLAR